MKRKILILFFLMVILAGSGTGLFWLTKVLGDVVVIAVWAISLSGVALTLTNSKNTIFRKLAVCIIAIVFCVSTALGFAKVVQERQKEYKEHLKQQVMEFEANNRGDSEIVKEQIIPLHEAAKSGNIREVEKLINEGENVDVKDSLAYTPLHLACIKGNLEIVELLVSKGADINARNDPRMGDTPLTLATEKGHWQIVKFLISKNADVNAYCLCSGTALHIAAKEGYVGLCKILLENGAKVNSTIGHIDEYIPLHEAAFEGNMEVVKLLLSYDADINARGCHNENTSVKETPLDLAKYEFDLMTKEKIAKKRLVVEYLLQCGAKTSAELDRI